MVLVAKKGDVEMRKHACIENVRNISSQTTCHKNRWGLCMFEDWQRG